LDEPRGRLYVMLPGRQLSDWNYLIHRWVRRWIGCPDSGELIASPEQINQHL